MDKSGSDSLGDCSGKLEMRPTGETHVEYSFDLGINGKYERHDEKIGTYRKAPVMSTTSE